MTRAFVTVESYFGGTRAIAEAIAAGLIEDGTEAQVIDVARASSALPSDLDLLALGTPTRNRRLSTMTTQAKAREQATSKEASLGTGEWLETMVIPTSIDATAFNTVISKGWLSDSAAKAITKTLQQRQGRRAVSVRSFVVAANKGSLTSGQETDAHNWGRELAASVNTR